MSKSVIVELEEGVWIADWSGDPGRTLKKENAKKYLTRSQAKRGLAFARRYRPFKNAKLEVIENE